MKFAYYQKEVIANELDFFTADTWHVTPGSSLPECLLCFQIVSAETKKALHHDFIILYLNSCDALKPYSLDFFGWVDWQILLQTYMYLLILIEFSLLFDTLLLEYSQTC